MAGPATGDRFVYTINGVKVVFPCKAYPTQLSMMNMIIKGIERHQNSLLESPTGSGKSLALLCSCLAWQAAEYEKKAKLEEEQNAAKVSAADGCSDKACGSDNKPLPTDKEIHLKSEYVQDNTTNAGTGDTDTPQKIEPVASPVLISETDVSFVGNVESGSPTDDDFQPAKKRFRTPGQQVAPSKKRRIQTPTGISYEDDSNCDPPEWKMELTRDGSGGNISLDAMATNENKEKCSADVDGKNDGKSETIRVPKIFFGTRTHKQIAQISRELRKTEYKKVRMTILSSREHSCVHPTVSKGKNKNEECRKLLDGSVGTTCRFYQKVHTIKSQTSLKCHGLSEAWDVEDLVTLGGQIKACPYYAARELMKEADIIFCPYNYLIDPKIRLQMDINLKDQIVVLDEAHNVEDSAREAASLTLTAVDLQNTLDDLDRLVQLQVLTENHRALHLMVGSFLRWIHESSSQLKERGFEQSSKVWSGMDIVAVMEKQGITPGTFYLHFEHFQFVMAAAKDPNRQGMPSLSSHSSTLLEGIFLLGKFMMGNNMHYISDYRCAILKTSVMVRDVHVLPGGWRRSHGGMRKEWTYSLNFWCLNPGVVFSEIGSETRCIILTSGTLSPMTSFSSELGVKFPIQLEANHVIANSQVWVGTLSTGPSGTAINASFQSSETFTFQDEVGKVVLNVCETVPHGVLCFFPSYNMLDKLSKRWQTTGLWSKLLDRKTIVSEPRSGDKLEFDDIMHQFYHAVRTSEGEESAETEPDDESCADGGLFLAVCRGKVSEGLDFADNNARAVITIGIPFPNVKDIQVELKRKYNTQYAASRGLLTGSEWYEIQAYRALNQALGRCIRHKQDWGAILLIDERFNKSPKYTNGISKWVRKRIYRFTNFGEAMSSLKEFAAARKLDPCPAATSPGSLSQLSRNGVETPAKENGFCIGRNHSVELTPLGKAQLKPTCGFTPVQYTNTDQWCRITAETLASPQSVHTNSKPSVEHLTLSKGDITANGSSTPSQFRHNDVKPAVAYTTLANPQGHANGGFTPGESFHTDREQIYPAQLGHCLRNPSCSFTPSTKINLISLDVTPNSPKDINFVVKSADQGKKERRVFNGMTLVLDHSPVNGFGLTRTNCRELQLGGNVENQASNCAQGKAAESQTLSEEPLSCSPVLFGTPSTTRSSSPASIEQALNLSKCPKGEDGTGPKPSAVNREPSQSLGYQEGFTDKDSVDASKKGKSFLRKSDNNDTPLVTEEDCIETCLGTDANNPICVPSTRKLFRSTKAVTSASDGEGPRNEVQEGEKPRDFLDDVKENSPLEKASESKNCLQSAEIKVGDDTDSKVVTSVARRSERSCKSVSEMPSNVRQATRSSTRLCRASTIIEKAKKQEEANEGKQEGDDGKPILFCTRCGSGLITGGITSKPCPKHLSEVIPQAVDEKNVLIIDRAACDIMNLNPLVDAKSDRTAGVKLNSIFVPDTDSCFIPQVCSMCQSVNRDSRLVGLEVVNFKSFCETHLTEPFPLKQVWLFPSLVYVGNS